MDIDTSKPNAGRIYDYYLGGNHNFEVDRAAAERLLSLMPSARSGALLNRWFMHDAVQRLSSEGFDCYLDLASGLPTQGYIHELAPDAKILYNDIDPVTVAYGRTIVGERSNVRFTQGDIRDIEGMLDAASSHFGEQRRIAICFIGATYFFDDATVQHVIDAMYKWSAPGTKMAMSWLVGDRDVFQASEFAAIYRRMGSSIYVRSLDDVRTMLKRWKLDEPGLLELSNWNGVDVWRIPGGLEDETVELYGSIITRP